MRHCPNCATRLTEGATTCPACFTAMVDASSSEAFQPGPLRRIQAPWRLQGAIVLGVVIGAVLGSVLERGLGGLTVALIVAGALAGAFAAQRLAPN